MSIIVIQSRRARVTGTTVEVIDNRDGSFDTSDLPWITFCDDHGNYCSHDTRRLALDWAPRPDVWCETCQKEAKRRARAMRYYSVGYDRGKDQWVILGWSRTPKAALARPGTRYRAYASSRQQAATLMRRDYGIDLQWKKFTVAPETRQPDPAKGEYLHGKEIRVCRGCNPASDVTAHTCGLSGLQDQLRIGG